MGKVAVLFISFVVIAGGFYYTQAGNAGGMMGGGGMVGTVEIPGNEPPQETNKALLQGYEQAKITCTQCHAMPDPGQHTRAEWPEVIGQMEDNIRTYHKAMPSAAALKSIVAYYTGNAPS